MLYGRIFQYETQKRYFAFEGASIESETCLVLIPGLTDGPQSLAYTDKLAEMLNEINISLIQPILTSSYGGYGYSSLETDCAEVDVLVHHLVNEKGKKGVILLGHSTGRTVKTSLMS